MALRSFTDRLVVAALATVFATTAARAHAGPLEDAESLVERGLEFRKNHENAKALDSFSRAYAIAPSPRIKAQIALAEQALGAWVDAEADLRAALDAQDDPWIQKHRGRLEEALALIESHLGWLVIESNVKGAEVRLDGKITGTTPLAAPVRVPTGSVVVELSAPGWVPSKRVVLILAGVRAQERFTLVSAAVPSVGPASTTKSPERPAPRPDDGTARTAGLISVGAGVVALGLGSYWGASAWSTRNERDRHCDDLGCDSTGLALDRDARADATRATVAFATGALAIGGGLVLMLVSGSSSKTAVTVQPTAGLRLTGIMVSAQW